MEIKIDQAAKEIMIDVHKINNSKKRQNSLFDIQKEILY